MPPYCELNGNSVFFSVVHKTTVKIDKPLGIFSSIFSYCYFFLIFLFSRSKADSKENGLDKTEIPQ